jgi:hypothetical protein
MVAAGFEEVRTEFERNFTELRLKMGSLRVVHFLIGCVVGSRILESDRLPLLRAACG